MSYYIVSNQYSHIWIISQLFWKISLRVLGCCFWEIYLFPRTFCFVNQPLSFRLLFLRDIAFVAKMLFFLVSGRTLIPECAYRPYDHIRLLVKWWHGKTQVESWVWGFSLIFDFSVYLKNSSTHIYIYIYIYICYQL